MIYLAEDFGRLGAEFLSHFVEGLASDGLVVRGVDLEPGECACLVAGVHDALELGELICGYGGGETRADAFGEGVGQSGEEVGLQMGWQGTEADGLQEGLIESQLRFR